VWNDDGTPAAVKEGLQAWMRLAVHNKAGRLAAEDVEVLLESVIPVPRAGGVGAPVLIASPPIRWTHLDERTVLIPQMDADGHVEASRGCARLLTWALYESRATNRN
jgi:hypothetical protein